MKMLLSTTRSAAVIFAVAFNSINLSGADQRAPWLGEISKEKSKSHDSLPREKSFDAPPLLPTRTSDIKVPVITRAKAQSTTSVKRQQEASKAFYSGDLSPRIQAATHQINSFKKSPLAVRFSEEIICSSSKTSNSPTKFKYSAANQYDKKEIPTLLIHNRQEAPSKDLQENPNLYVTFKEAIDNCAKIKVEKSSRHEITMNLMYRTWLKDLSNDSTYITRKIIKLKEQGSYLLAQYTTKAVVHEPTYDNSFANKYEHGWIFTVINEQDKCPILPSWQECIKRCALNADDTIGMHSIAIDLYRDKCLCADPASIVKNSFSGRVGNFHWKIHSTMPPCLPRIVYSYVVKNNKGNTAHPLVLTCKNFYEYYDQYWKKF